MLDDPLVTLTIHRIEATGASLVGLAAAEVLARMRSLNMISAADAKVILGRAFPDLDEQAERFDYPPLLDDVPS
jgi:hypothetical protein